MGWPDACPFTPFTPPLMVETGQGNEDHKQITPAGLSCPGCPGALWVPCTYRIPCRLGAVSRTVGSGRRVPDQGTRLLGPLGSRDRVPLVNPTGTGCTMDGGIARAEEWAKDGPKRRYCS